MESATPESPLTPSLVAYVEAVILPQYDAFDAGHRRDHAQHVIESSLYLARAYDVDKDMVYAIAACHDLGLRYGREHHHTDSARLLLADERLPQWFTSRQLALMADAVEDHRASADRPPRTLYGCIVADADHDSDALTVVRRTVQYGLHHYPDLTADEHVARAVAHLDEKYAPDGYLHYWLPESRRSPRRQELYALIADRPRLLALVRHLLAEEQLHPDR